MSEPIITRTDLNERLPSIVDALVRSIVTEPTIHHLNRVFLPSRDVIIQAIDLMRQMVYPGYFGQQGINAHNIAYRLGSAVIGLTDKLFKQVRCCLRYRKQIPGNNGDTEECEECDYEAARIVATFFDRFPAVREMLASDVRAAFDGDPAAQSTD